MESIYEQRCVAYRAGSQYARLTRSFTPGPNARKSAPALATEKFPDFRTRSLQILQNLRHQGFRAGQLQWLRNDGRGHRRIELLCAHRLLPEIDEKDFPSA